MEPEYYWKERCVTLSSVVASFAVFLFMFTIMFLAGSANYYTADTNDMVAPRYTYVSYDAAIDGED
jgi:hypothetical protein